MTITDAPSCTRDGCCSGLMAALHARTDAYNARAMRETAERAQVCEAEGHVLPSRMRWQSAATRCDRCSAVIA